MSKIDFLRIEKSSGKCLLRPATHKVMLDPLQTYPTLSTEVSFLLQETISLTVSHCTITVCLMNQG